MSIQYTVPGFEPTVGDDVIVASVIVDIVVVSVVVDVVSVIVDSVVVSVVVDAVVSVGDDVLSSLC